LVNKQGWEDMRRTARVQEAKTRLSATLADVERGEEVAIAHGDVPVAQLIAVQEPSERELGFVPYRIPDSFNEPLPAHALAAWEACRRAD
jgi:antitoxin (DNA-binding transcriptional repressor) of toxin-antitoxin stability system